MAGQPVRYAGMPLLYRNQKDGTFAEEALLRGAALDENGKEMSLRCAAIVVTPAGVETRYSGRPVPAWLRADAS
jgi:hypothetical protein